MPKFTMETLRTLAEIVGVKRLDPRGFRRRVLALELIEETGNQRPAVVGRRGITLRGGDDRSRFSTVPEDGKN